MPSFFIRLLPRGTTQLFRAVTEQERNDIRSERRFRNPKGIECKYFARTMRQAATYAELAAKAYLNGPFFIYRAHIATRLITDEMCVNVEEGIQVIVIPSELLPEVSAPRFVGRVLDK